MDSPAIVKISNVVMSYLNEIGQGTDDFFRLLQIVTEGLSTELNVTHAYSIKAYFTTVSSVNTVDFPSDLIKLSRVGILIDGLVYTLTKNNNIALNQGDICGVEMVADENLDAQRMPTTLNYARGGGFNIASYTVNDRTVIFKGSLADQTIVLEYKSSGINMSGETFIPTLLIPPLKEYLNWRLTKADKSASQLSKFEAKKEFYRVKREYIKRKNPFNMHDVLDVINSGRGQSSK
jgi:hypothetical protein